MNENINLCNILKDCPKGEKFYSPLLGNVTFAYISWDFDKVIVTCCDKKDDTTEYDIEFDGHIIIGGVRTVEIMLYPSKDQLDWSKWEYPKPKKPKFDPKTLNAFDRVIIKREFDGCYLWFPSLFAYYNDGCRAIDGHFYLYMIPYNDETKHLVYTKDEAPEHYRYWED